MKLSSSWWKETGHVLIKLASQIMILSQQTRASSRWTFVEAHAWISVLTHNPTCFIYMYQIAIIFPIKFPSYQQTLISLDEWYIQQAANWFLYSMVASWFPNNSANISVVWWQRFRVSRSAHEVCITEPEIQKLSMLLEKCRFWYKTKRRCPYSDHYSLRPINMF